MDRTLFFRPLISAFCLSLVCSCAAGDGAETADGTVAAASDVGTGADARSAHADMATAPGAGPTSNEVSPDPAGEAAPDPAGEDAAAVPDPSTPDAATTPNEATAADAHPASPVTDPYGPEVGAHLCQPAPDGVGVGTRLGQRLVDLTLRGCDGEPVNISDLCGARAVWIFGAHAWCPHCNVTASFAERIHDSVTGQGLVTLQVLVQNERYQLPTVDDCRRWRDRHGHEDVITLFAPGGEANALWDTGYTALNLYLDSRQVIIGKAHSDNEVAIQRSVVAALTAP